LNRADTIQKAFDNLCLIVLSLSGFVLAYIAWRLLPAVYQVELPIPEHEPLRLAFTIGIPTIFKYARYTLGPVLVGLCFNLAFLALGGNSELKRRISRIALSLAWTFLLFGAYVDSILIIWLERTTMLPVELQPSLPYLETVAPALWLSSYYCLFVSTQELRRPLKEIFTLKSSAMFFFGILASYIIARLIIR